MRTSRTWFWLAWETYWSPDRTCRYQRRKKTTANSTSAMPPMTAMRRAREGLIGGRRASGSWITGSREGAQSGPGARATAAAQLVGQRRRQPAAGQGEDGQRDERVDEDGGDDLAHEQQADRRVDAEQELDDPVAALRHQRRN